MSGVLHKVLHACVISDWLQLRLLSLDLYGNPIGDEGVIALANSLQVSFKPCYVV